MELAPIVIFVYNRPWHTRQMVEALQRNELAAESELFVFSDGPKTGSKADVNATREYIRNISGFRNISITEREENLGLADSIISGVTELCERFGRVIVLEDDLVVSRYFLRYMNMALDRYEKENKVMQISGHMFPVDLKIETDAVFLPFITSWGWATWKRAWDNFDFEIKGYEAIRIDKKTRYKFDLYGSYPYFSMLESQVGGMIDSWAIRWYLSTFLLNGLTLYPARSLVLNIGFDGSGTHCDHSSGSQASIDDFSVNIFPEVNVSEPAFETLREHFYKYRSLGAKIRNKLIRLKDRIVDIAGQAKYLS